MATSKENLEMQTDQARMMDVPGHEMRFGGAKNLRKHVWLQQETRVISHCFTTFVDVHWMLIGNSLSKFGLDIEGSMVRNCCWMSPTQDLKGHYLLFTSLDIFIHYHTQECTHNIPTRYPQSQNWQGH